MTHRRLPRMGALRLRLLTGAAVALGVLTVTVLGPMAAAGDAVWQRERARISGSVPGSESGQVWLREGDANRQMIIRGGRQEQASGRLLDATFFIYTTTSTGRRVFTERIDAATATLNAGRWRLTDASGAQPAWRLWRQCNGTR